MYIIKTLNSHDNTTTISSSSSSVKPLDKKKEADSQEAVGHLAAKFAAKFKKQEVLEAVGGHL